MAMRQSAIGLVGAWMLLCCSDANQGQSMSDAGGNQAACEASYQAALDRTCLMSADCVLVGHDDCCGTVRVGVRAGTEAAAMTAEATCRVLQVSHALDGIGKDLDDLDGRHAVLLCKLSDQMGGKLGLYQRSQLGLIY